MNKEHTLLCVMGRTASGKDSLVNKLCERTGFKQLQSYTTRNKRAGEGDTHVFVSEDDYNLMLSNNEVAVDTNIDGNYYWSKINQLYESDVYIVDYVGLQKLKSLHLPNLRLVSVFINVPDDIRENRALNHRYDDKTKFRTRNFAEREQFREMAKNLDFDYSISNIDLVKAYSVLRWISDVEKIWQNYKEDKK